MSIIRRKPHVQATIGGKSKIQFSRVIYELKKDINQYLNPLFEFC